MKETTVSSQTVFAGRLLRVDVLEIRQTNGRLARREIVRHPGAVAVWARLPDGRFAFVRQFRKPVEQELLEIVAGTRDADESAAECAVREVREETGYTVRRLRPLGSVYAAPGFCTERMDLFFADLADQPGRPEPDPDEQVELVALTPAATEAAFARGDIQDGKTWVAWGMLQTTQAAWLREGIWPEP